MSEERQQLHLFDRQRGKPVPATEFATCCALADTIRRLIKPEWRFTASAAGERRDTAIDSKGRRYSPSGARLKRMGLNPGWPDYEFRGPGGRSFLMEMKRGRLGRLSEAQADIAAHLLANGHDYLCALSYREAIEALVARGIIRNCKTW